MLSIKVRLMKNPWLDSIGDDMLFATFTAVASARAEHVEKQHAAGVWQRNSLGLAFLDPSAPVNQRTHETLLATIAIGEEGERFIPNAVAKAAYHRDHGVPAGYGVYMDLSMSRDGDFCYGYSTQVDGLIAGASAQSEIQDACEAGHAAVTLLYHLRRQRAEWKQSQALSHWFGGHAHETYIHMANQRPIREDGTHPAVT